MTGTRVGEIETPATRLEQIGLTRSTLAWTAGLVLVIALLALSPIQVLGTLVIGLQQGAIYSLVALGIVLVYKATRVLNFAQGELGTVPAFVAYWIMAVGDVRADSVALDLSRIWWATIIALIAGIVLAMLVNTLIVQRLAEASPVTSLVATIGIAIGLSAAEIVVFETRARRFPRYVEGGPCLEAAPDGTCANVLSLGGVNVSWHTIIILGVLAVTALLLAIFFKTRIGTALLATAQEPFAAQLQGISVRGMATLAWGAAGLLAAIGGLLGAGVFNAVQPGLMTSTFLIPAFVGAVLGGLRSMVGAVVGGLILGVAIALAGAGVLAYGLTGVIPGVPQATSLLVLLLVLLVKPEGLFSPKGG